MKLRAQLFDNLTAQFLLISAVTLYLSKFCFCIDCQTLEQSFGEVSTFMFFKKEA